MAKEEAPNPNIKKANQNIYGGLALSLLEQNPDLAAGALEEMVYSEWSEDRAKNLMNGFYASKEATKVAAEGYGNDYHEAKAGLTVSELYDNIYKKDVKSYFKGDTLKAVETLIAKYGSETYGSIAKKMARASHIKKGEKAFEYTDEQKKDAENTLKKYANIFQILEELESMKLQGVLGPKATIRVLKRNAEGLGNMAKQELEAA